MDRTRDFDLELGYSNRKARCTKTMENAYRWCVCVDLCTAFFSSVCLICLPVAFGGFCLILCINQIWTTSNSLSR